MKNILDAWCREAFASLDWEAPPESLIERPRDGGHGDYSCHVALRLGKRFGQPPLEVARTLVAHLPPHPGIERIEILPPGFINFHLAHAELVRGLARSLEGPLPYGHVTPGRARILVEFVSANPNGPLHVGHGRGAAYGDSLANLLEALGYVVEREYYVNDAGRQMSILALSVWLRYLENRGCPTQPFPHAGYQGGYVLELAGELAMADGDRYERCEPVLQDLPPDGAEPEGAADRHIDARVAAMKTALGPAHYAALHDFVMTRMSERIRRDLRDFGVHHDRWFSERSLYDSGQVTETIGILERRGETYRADGALWFRAEAHGDEKDRVLVRANGEYTYFSPDLAYHRDKLKRGYDRLINVLGADHHGYAPRIRAGIEALGEDPTRLEVLFVQFAVLLRGGQKVQMSTRSGSFIALSELVAEVGRDAARFFYVLRSEAQHLDFDLDLAKRQSQENPVYYVQYAHARVASLWRECEERGLAYDPNDRKSFPALTHPLERTLLLTLIRYPEMLEQAASARAPHLVAHFLRELAAAFHGYYNGVPLLIDEPSLRNARLSLCRATRLVLADGLALLGVSAPVRM